MTSDKSIATLRFKWNSSIIKVTATSISDIEEVSAAINKVKRTLWLLWNHQVSGRIFQVI